MFGLSAPIEAVIVHSKTGPTRYAVRSTWEALELLFTVLCPNFRAGHIDNALHVFEPGCWADTAGTLPGPILHVDMPPRAETGGVVVPFERRTVPSGLSAGGLPSNDGAA